MSSPKPPPPHLADQTANQNAPRATTNSRPATSLSLRRLPLQTAPNPPRPQSPALNSPRRSAEPHRIPSSPGFSPHSVRRSPSLASLNRSSSPALGRKSSTSSLRGDMPTTPRAPVSRRSSFNPNVPSPIGARSPLQSQIDIDPPKPPLRPCDIAEEHFKKELLLHEDAGGKAGAGTIVIVHDQCYGHRFSRPKTTKSTLNFIMERPERILASVLGISAAYVLLGERHSEGGHPLHPDREPSERIPFRIRKTSRAVDITSPAVTNVHGTKWMAELKSLCTGAERKLASTGKELTRDPPTLPGQPANEKFHEGDLYLCSESLNALQGALGGVLDAVDAVFKASGTDRGPSRAFVCVRPPGHHCSADWPSGFCWINNVHVGIEHAMANYGLTHAAIIDFDLHHGDGSQSITWARNKKVQSMSKNTPNWKKTSIGYFSIHDINSYPCEDGDDAKVQAASLCIDNAHGQSIWNIHLDVWKTPEEFWSIYEEKYLVLLEKVRQYLKHHTNRLRNSPNHPTPKAAIFLSAGFDASEWETAGMQRHSVNVLTEFYARFTRDVVRLAEEVGTGVEGRIISVLEGGYSDRALASGVLSHISGLCDGQVFSEPPPSKGLEFDMRQRLSRLESYAEEPPQSPTEPELKPVTYDPRWWHATKLAELENLVTPPLQVVPKKVRTGPPPNFSSPTQSFTAKVVDPSKLHRGFSGRLSSSSPSRASTPPPPEVDWATASHALSRLLIPSDRQTRSCKPEELAEPKVKKEKPLPALASVHVDPSGRQLRGRKPIATYADPDSGDDKKSMRAESRANRRRTIADLPLATEGPAAASRSASRRMSIASSVGSVNGDERSTSRASSVMPPRKSVTPAPGATSNSVQVKKARPTATAPSRIPKNPPPVPRLPSSYTSKNTSPKEEELPKEKENEIDQITSGLKRITLKLPSREEYEARERQREAEKKAAAKPTTKKAGTSRATKIVTKSATTKRGSGRPPKLTKPPSPIEPDILASQPEQPRMETTSTARLEQPQPVQPDHVSTLTDQTMALQSALPGHNMASVTVKGRPSTDLVEPPTELTNMDITPEQLPKPSFVTAAEPLPITTSPPRPDTPPPPPPSAIPQFVNYTSQTFNMGPGSGQTVSQETRPSNLQWLPPNMDATVPTTASALPAVNATRPMSPASKRQDLPVFTANGVIPFAPNTNSATSDAQATPSKTGEGIWEVPETPTR